MKIVILGIGIALISASAAQAATCAQRAANCMTKGGTQAICYEGSRMASCEATGQYVGPSGKSWPATRAGKK
jgi:hypothetical protein